MGARWTACFFVLACCLRVCLASSSNSALLTLACDFVAMYSPSPMEMAPATAVEMAVSSVVLTLAPPATSPTTTRKVEMMPSFTPSMKSRRYCAPSPW